jgi:uncharacterized membrane protein YdjX (TVP38/TMEM64 family)
LRRVLLGLWLLVIAAALYFYIFQRAAIQAELQNALSTSALIAGGVYLLLGSVRAFTLVPSTFLVIVGLPFLPPGRLLVLTLIGILISSSLIYWFADELRLAQEIERKYPAQITRLKALLQRHEMPIIIGWSFFPLLPTDVICYVCGALEIDYKKFLLGVTIGEGTICAIYIYLGGKFF